MLGVKAAQFGQATLESLGSHQWDGNFEKIPHIPSPPSNYKHSHSSSFLFCCTSVGYSSHSSDSKDDNDCQLIILITTLALAFFAAFGFSLKAFYDAYESGGEVQHASKKIKKLKDARGDEPAGLDEHIYKDAKKIWMEKRSEEIVQGVSLALVSTGVALLATAAAVHLVYHGAVPYYPYFFAGLGATGLGGMCFALNRWARPRKKLRERCDHLYQTLQNNSAVQKTNLEMRPPSVNPELNSPRVVDFTPSAPPFTPTDDQKIANY